LEVGVSDEVDKLNGQDNTAREKHDGGSDGGQVRRYEQDKYERRSV
jgi:hypothetical protein